MTLHGLTDMFDRDFFVDADVKRRSGRHDKRNSFRPQAGSKRDDTSEGHRDITNRNPAHYFHFRHVIGHAQGSDLF